MKFRFPVLCAALLLIAQPSSAQKVEEVKKITTETPSLPEDLFRLPPGSWYFSKELWAGDAPCTTDECEAGYNSGDLVISVERNKGYLRIISGFRGCASVSWSEYEIGKSASSSDTKTVGKRIKKAVETAAKYCKLTAPTVPALDTRQLFPVPAQTTK
jgi:hypothetical protein